MLPQPFDKFSGKAKFVNVGTHVYVFPCELNHNEQVEDGEKAISAGFIKFASPGGVINFRIITGKNSRSNSLTLDPIPEVDGPAIVKFLENLGGKAIYHGTFHAE